MRIKPLLLLIFLAVFSAAAFAQSVVITSKKTTYTRKSPQMDFKKTFTVNRPIVKASTPALTKKIQTAISFEKVMGFNLKEEQTEIQWLEEADYEVHYNDKGILNIWLSMSGTGAYPSFNTESVVVNTKTGNAVKAADVFTNLQGLAKLVKKDQKEEIKASIEEIKKDKDFNEPNPETLFESTDFTVENLEGFSVDANGVTFQYSYGFPHVIQALEPSGAFVFTWKQLKPYIKPTGLFGQFVK
ncbi:MAG TPA: hypothetical protein PKY59_21595 [Pyrinomonadaceae bacterium]|nr:hypothetical protein [Pyrinomonadaceae bacterium]